MEPDLIAEAMALAVELRGQERLVAADRPATATWLREGLDAVAYDQPAGPDADGFITVGERRVRRADGTGFGLVHPDTTALRLAGSHAFGHCAVATRSRPAPLLVWPTPSLVTRLARSTRQRVLSPMVPGRRPTFRIS